MRYVALVTVFLAACAGPTAELRPGTYAVLRNAVEIRRVETEGVDDCRIEDLCIRLVAGYAEYTYLANTLNGYVHAEKSQRLKVIGGLGHYGDLSYSLIDPNNVVRLGELRGRTIVESSARVFGNGAEAYIVDPRFIEQNQLASLYKPAPKELDYCVSRSDGDPRAWDEVMSTPRAFENSKGEACYGSAVSLQDLSLSVSNRAVQADQPPAGR